MGAWPGFAVASTILPCQSLVSVLSDQFRRDAGQRVLAEKRCQWDGPSLLADLREWALGWRDIRQVPRDCLLERQALGRTTLQEHPAHHLILGAASPVLGVPL